MHEDLPCTDRLAILHVLLPVVLGEEVGCLGCKFLENGSLVMLADEGLVGWVMELVVVPGGMGDLELRDVLEGGWEGAISCDVLIEMLLVLILVVVERDQEEITVELPLALQPLLIPLLELLHLLGAPAELEGFLSCLPLPRAV